MFQSTTATLLEKKLVERGSLWGGLKSELPVALVVPVYVTEALEIQDPGLDMGSGEIENKESMNNIREIVGSKEEKKEKENEDDVKEMEAEKGRRKGQIQGLHRARNVSVSYIPYPLPSSWCGEHQSTILRKPYISLDANYAFDNSSLSIMEDVAISFNAKVHT